MYLAHPHTAWLKDSLKKDIPLLLKRASFSKTFATLLCNLICVIFVLSWEIGRILEDLYEAHGDTLALQYGGSQLVHGYALNY